MMIRIWFCLALLLVSMADGIGAASNRPGMGAIPYDGGVTFRVWAPHANSVNVAGLFNGWNTTANALRLESSSTGLWSADVPGAAVGQPYKYVLNGGLWKQDPRARQVGADGNGIIYKTDAFDWSGDAIFARPAVEDLVAYEMHIGTFNAPRGIPGTFDDAIARLDFLAALGVTLLEVMPINSFAPSPQSWGYDPRGIFAVEETYGGPDAFKRFVKAAHARGMAVHLDIVHNHYGGTGSAGDLWNFDGFAGGGNGGGIYFYQAPYLSGAEFGPRPNYAEPGVVNFITDSVKMWLDEYHLDGFRWDDVKDIETYDIPGQPRPYNVDGERLLQNINGLIHASYPGRISLDEESNEPVKLGFDASWFTQYPYSLRDYVLAPTDDDERRMDWLSWLVRTSVSNWSKVIYTDSHDTSGDLNGGNRLPAKISPATPTDYWARKRSMLGAAMAFTLPSIPMLLQGTEMLETRQFSSATALNWTNATTYATTVKFYQDLIKLRRNLTGKTAGLRGKNLKVTSQEDAANKVIAYYRWDHTGTDDDTVVVLNFKNSTPTVPIVFPRDGTWTAVMNTDSTAYGSDFGNAGTSEVSIRAMNEKAEITIGPYSALIYSRTSYPDTDGDGIPDVWETLYGLNPNDNADATFDPDGDGIANLQEYINNGDPHLSLAQSLNLPGTTAPSGGENAVWFDQMTTTHDGVDAAQSGHLVDSQTSFFQVPVTGPDTISFWWKVSSEIGYDYLSVSLDGVRITRISGETDWTQLQTQIPSGSHTLRFAYTKDSSVSSGSDAAWVDQIVTNVPRITQIVAHGDDPVSIAWSGKAGRSYTVQYSDDLASWQNLDANTYSSPTDATLTAFDPGLPRPSRRFYRVQMAP